MPDTIEILRALAAYDPLEGEGIARQPHKPWVPMLDWPADLFSPDAVESPGSAVGSLKPATTRQTKPRHRGRRRSGKNVAPAINNAR